MKKYIFWVVAGLCSFVLSLLVTMPLTAAVQQIMNANPAVQFAGVQGTLWKGSVDRVQLSPQLELTDLQWKLAPQTLLRGFVGFDISSAQLKSIEGRGQCGITLLLNIHCATLTVQADAARLPELAPGLRRLPVQFEGRLLALLNRFTWDREHVPLLDGSLALENSRIRGAISLELGGQYVALLSSSADNELLLELQSEETQVILSGDVRSNPQGAYEMEVFVRAADTAPRTTAPALELALESAGAPQNDGSIRIQQQGQIPPQWFNLSHPAPAQATE